MLRTLGYWLLYAFAGAIFVVMLFASFGDLGSANDDSPTSVRAKILGALSGAGLFLLAIGALFLWDDPHTSRETARALIVVGAAAACTLTPYALVVIHRDLNRS